MKDDNLKKESQLRPIRHPQAELFLCDIADAALKADMASMEHPIFALSKNPDTKIHKYTNGDNWLEITPSVKGRANIYDRDVLIYAVSKIASARNKGMSYSRFVEFDAMDYLIFTNRMTSGREYNALLILKSDHKRVLYTGQRGSYLQLGGEASQPTDF